MGFLEWSHDGDHDLHAEATRLHSLDGDGLEVEELVLALKIHQVQEKEQQELIDLDTEFLKEIVGVVDGKSDGVEGEVQDS